MTDGERDCGEREVQQRASRGQTEVDIGVPDHPHDAVADQRDAQRNAPIVGLEAHRRH
jgi:hypothetical protein